GGYEDRLAIVRHVGEDAFLTFFAVMAVVAIDADCAVSALLPFAVHPGRDLRVAGGAILADRDVERGFLRFGCLRGRARRPRERRKKPLPMKRRGRLRVRPCESPSAHFAG